MRVHHHNQNINLNNKDTYTRQDTVENLCGQLSDQGGSKR